MKKSLFFLIFLFSMSIISCKSDSSGEMDAAEVETMVDDLLEEQMAEMAVSNEVENEVEVPLEEVSVDQKKVLEQKKEILKEQLKESPNLGKDCESILKEYSEMVDQYLKEENVDAILSKLAEWANDPIFNRCKKSAEYKDKFFDLEERMYADEEIEY